MTSYSFLYFFFFILFCFFFCLCFFFQAEDGIRDLVRSRGLGDVYKRQVLWFGSLFLSGFFYIIHMPEIFLALNPLYAIEFFIHNGLPGFFILSEVILCATGGEALYADMGHLGGKPIRQAWGFVFIALIINYLGQGAYIIEHNDSNPVSYTHLTLPTSDLV